MFVDSRSCITWKHIAGTFSWERFYSAFSEKVVPRLNPWLLQRSITVMDNAKIHILKELEDTVY